MNSHDGSIDANEATRLLKHILRVGKAYEPPTAGDAEMTTNGSMEASASGQVETASNAGGENLLDSLFRNTQPQDQHQSIHLSENEEDVSVDVFGQEVHVVVSPPHDSTSSSNRVKIKNIVDYGWELKYNLGKHVCVHVSGTYLAYAIRAATSPSGAVRVLNHKTGERTLVKGLRGLVQDMGFAWLSSRILLAIVDEYGTLYVYEIDDESGSLTPTLLLQVERPVNEKPSEYRRVVWCSYVPDGGIRAGDSDEDASKLLVVTNLEEAEVWNVGTVVREYGCGILTPEKVSVGLQRMLEHTMPITDVAFSPDGTALATASSDGEVGFFQVYTQEAMIPKCLHRWVPHKKKPISCLFFLDNVKSCSPDTQFWRFALTGAEHNTELKLWSCMTWACLQTIRFFVAPDDPGQLPAFKAEIDPSASYLVLSDIHRKVVYVAQLQIDEQYKEGRLVSLAQFPVILPVLSFTVVEAVRCRFKPSTDTEHVDRLDAEHQAADGEEEVRGSEKRHEGTLVRLFWMNTKSLQACHIVYPTAVASSAASIRTLSQHSLVSGCTDHLSELGLDAEEAEKSKEEEYFPDKAVSEDTRDPTPSDFSTAEVLLTPSDFTSPSHVTILTSTNAAAGPLVVTPCTLTPANHSGDSDSATSLSEETPDGMPLLESIPLLEAMTAETPLLAETRPCQSGEDDGPAAGEPEPPREVAKSTQRPSSQQSTTSTSSHEVADILAPSERLANASHSTEEEEELDLGLDYDSAAEELQPIGGHSEGGGALLAPPVEVPLVSACDETYVEESSQGKGDGAWPELPSSTEAYAAVASGLAPVLPPVPPPVPVEELQLLATQQLEQTSALAQSLAALASQVQRMSEQHSQTDDLLSSLVAENRATRAALTRFEATMAQLSSEQRISAEKQANAVVQHLSSSLSASLDKSISREMKTSVVPVVCQTMDGMCSEVSKRLEATEVTVKDSVSKMTKSKALIEAVSQATSIAVQPHVTANCREILQNTLIPTVEHLCQNLFLRLNESFSRGTREFVHQVQVYLEKKSKERVDEMTKNVRQSVERHLQSSERYMQASVRNLQESLAIPDLQGPMERAVHEAVQGLGAAVHQSLAGQQEQLLAALKEELRETLKESVAQAAAEGATVRSQMATPVPMADPQLLQQQIGLLVRQGHYNTAFQQALSVADLSVVVATCEMVSPSSLFDASPCPLQQPVLLSLIQQLCADLAANTDLKLRYLEEAVLSLDREYPVTKEHVKAILTLLCQKLNKFLVTQPKHQLARNVKRLLMVSQSLLTS
uniref:Putative enhancer of mrna-decapping protein 4 n=1 Tax=Ixodes ricinus TaxID=34613 RepID=A0A131XR08_IXORI